MSRWALKEISVEPQLLNRQKNKVQNTKMQGAEGDDD
jgi:hypothetical protein